MVRLLHQNTKIVNLSLASEPCVSDENGRNSTCVLLSDCDVAKTNIKINKRPQTCGFVGIEPKVCCPGYQETRQNLQYRVRTGHLAVKGLEVSWQGKGFL